VLHKDGHQCTWVERGARCPVTSDGQLDAHHTEPGNDDPLTGRTLCNSKAFGHHGMVDGHAR
jgi:hypothetical protein